MHFKRHYTIITRALQMKYYNNKRYGPLAQLVEHLTLNQGVQGSNPWRSTASTIFEDTGALGMVLFLRAMSHAKNKKEHSGELAHLRMFLFYL